MISITIPVINGYHLDEVLSSIASQTSNDHETIVINDSKNKKVSLLIKKYGAIELISNGSLMKARYIGVKNAKGEYVLQLDETRVLTDNMLLEKLNNLQKDAIFISEIENGKGFFLKAANIDKNLLITSENINKESPSVLPRFYKTDILKKAMEILKNNLGDMFDQITAPEDLLIFTEAKNFIKTTYLLEDSKIAHYGDDSLKNIVTKYYRYGKDFSKLSDTKYYRLVEGTGLERMRSRMKNINSYNDMLMVALLFFVRGLSLEFGKIVRKYKRR